MKNKKRKEYLTYCTFELLFQTGFDKEVVETR